MVLYVVDLFSPLVVTGWSELIFSTYETTQIGEFNLLTDACRVCIRFVYVWTWDLPISMCPKTILVLCWYHSGFWYWLNCLAFSQPWGRRLVGPIVVGFEACYFFRVKSTNLWCHVKRIYVWYESGSSTAETSMTMTKAGRLKNRKISWVLVDEA